VHPYPDATTVADFLAGSRELLVPLGFEPSTTLPLVSVCRDELMFPFIDAVAEQWGHCFDMSGLAGLPLLGRTGVAAALGHAPDAGGRHRLVAFAFPHIGIDADDEVGAVHRPGVPGATAACGAVDVARRALVRGVSGVVLDPHDVEESLLVARLRQVLGDGVVPGMVEVTELVRRCAVEELTYLLSGLSTSDAVVDYALLSGVVVHDADADHVALTSVTVSVDDRTMVVL
jgi:hypothetical protein